MLSMTRTSIGYKPNSGIYSFAAFTKNDMSDVTFIQSRTYRLYVVDVSVLSGEPKIYDSGSLPQVRQTGG